MIYLYFSGKCDLNAIEHFSFDPQRDYVSFNHFKLLEVDGKKLLLDLKEVTCKTSNIVDGVPIHWANWKCFKMYDDAVMITTGVGVLLLDCMCPG